MSITKVRTSPSGPNIIIPVPPELVVPPYKSTAFVDTGTTLPIASQTGSVTTPFATIQQAVDATVADGRVVVYCYLFGEISTSGVVVPDGFFLGVRAMEPGPLFLESLSIGELSTVILEDCIAKTATKTGTTGTLCMSVTQPNRLVDSVSLLDLANFQVQLVNVGLFGTATTCLTAGVVYLEGCTLNFTDTVVGVDCLALTALNTLFTGAAMTLRSAVNSLFKGCEFGADITVDNVGSTPAEFDSYSNYRFKNAGGCSVLNPGKVVISDAVP